MEEDQFYSGVLRKKFFGLRDQGWSQRVSEMSTESNLVPTVSRFVLVLFAFSCENFERVPLCIMHSTYPSSKSCLATENLLLIVKIEQSFVVEKIIICGTQHTRKLLCMLTTTPIETHS